jgi:ElaB/YqjD/DUF883 family membrane-anchored ribosome-binding protein
MTAKTFSLLAVALLLINSACSQNLEYGEALAKLEGDKKQAVEKMQEAEAKTAEKLDQASAKPADAEAHKGAAQQLDDMVRVYDEQIDQLENDLSVLEASGNALLDKVGKRTELIKDVEIKAAENQRLQNARAKLRRDLAAVRVSIGGARSAIVQAKDLVLVAQNSQDLRKLTANSRSILDLSAKSKTLIASINGLTREQDLLAAAAD